MYCIQLLGAAALFIASKYEDISSISSIDLLYFSSNVFTNVQLISMESILLNELQFSITVPSTYTFCQRFFHHYSQQQPQKDNTIFHMIHFLAEVSLLHYHMLHYLPSHIAAAAIYVSLNVIHLPWSNEMATYTLYDERSLQVCSKDLYDIAKTSNATISIQVHDKFSTKKYSAVSLTILSSVLNPFNLE
jgi:hypothetical protein